MSNFTAGIETVRSTSAAGMIGVAFCPDWFSSCAVNSFSISSTSSLNSGVTAIICFRFYYFKITKSGFPFWDNPHNEGCF